MVDKCRVCIYYPSSFPVDGNINYIATLDGKYPVQVFYNHFASRYWCSTTVNLFYIVDMYTLCVPEEEDWYVAYKAGFPFDEDIRHRNIRKYTKALVVEMLERLCSHKEFKHYCIGDIYVNSVAGESASFFRPYKTIHVTINYSKI